MWHHTIVVLLIAASAAQISADCIESFQHYGHPVKPVTSTTAKDWGGMLELCYTTFPHWVLLQAYENLTADDKKLCPSNEVPYGVYYEERTPVLMGSIIGKERDTAPTAILDKMDKSKPAVSEEDMGDGIVNLDTGLWYFVPMEDSSFTCALCQMSGWSNLTAHVLDESTLYKYNNYYFYSVKVVGNSTLTKLVVPTDKEKIDMAKAIAKLLKTAIVDSVVYRDAKLANGTGFLEVTFPYRIEKTDSSVLPLNLAKLQKVKMLTKYLMSVEDVSNCPEEKVKGKTGNATIWANAEMGTIKVVTDKKTMLTTRRECTFNVSADRPRWSETTVWEMKKIECSEYAQYANDLAYQEHLGPEIALNQKNRLKKFAVSPIDTKAFAEVANLTSREIVVVNELPETMALDLVKILTNLKLPATKKDFTTQRPQANFVVADTLNVTKSVNGFTLVYTEDTMGVPVDPIKLALSKKGGANVTNPRPTVSVTVSNGLMGLLKRIAFSIYFKHIEKLDAMWATDNNETPQYLEVDVILVPGAKGVDGINLGATGNFVDITYTLLSESLSKKIEMTCAAWDDDASLWSTKECVLRESTVATMATCRCATKLFENRAGVLSGSFALKKEFTKEHQDFRGFQEMFDYYY